jgi:LacI family transcriptional regulator
LCKDRSVKENPEEAGAKSKRVTMTDVARRAGVSQPTVSLVLNDRRDQGVAEDTRQRVLKAAAELGFRPNRTAQALRLNRSFTVGIISHGIASRPYAGPIIQGIQQAVQQSNLLTMLVDSGSDYEAGEEAIANLLDHGVMGIIYAAISPHPIALSPLIESSIRTIFVNCWPKDNSEQVETVILPDEYGGGRAAARAAFEQGHTNVAFLGGDRGEYACVERMRGFVDEAKESGLDPAKLPQLTGRYSIESGFDQTKQVFTDHRPTALVCGNDRMAIGALLALHSLGLDAPDDVSLVGYDDQLDVASVMRPPLTTVSLPHYLMGYRAGTLLVDAPAEPLKEVLVPCQLVVRDSVRSPQDNPKQARTIT